MNTCVQIIKAMLDKVWHLHNKIKRGVNCEKNVKIERKIKRLFKRKRKRKAKKRKKKASKEKE